MKNMIHTGPDQPFRCLEEATHVGCGCSETLFSGIAPARLDQQESQPGRQRHFCNCLISKYFCYCRAFQLILVIERASSLPQLLSPAAN